VTITAVARSVAMLGRDGLKGVTAGPERGVQLAATLERDRAI